MAPNHGIFGTYEKEVAIRSIRQCAQEMVGPCTDGQILFVAATMGKGRCVESEFGFASAGRSLVDLEEAEVEELNIWMVDQLNRFRLQSVFGKIPKW